MYYDYMISIIFLSLIYSWEPKFNLVFDVGKIDVVIFDCYVCDVMINICVISRLIFLAYF